MNVYIIKLIKHKNDKPHDFVNSNIGLIISILFYLSVQTLFNSSGIFTIYI